MKIFSGARLGTNAFTGLFSYSDCHSLNDGDNFDQQTTEKATEPLRCSYFAQDYTSAKWQGYGFHKFNQI